MKKFVQASVAAIALIASVTPCALAATAPSAQAGPAETAHPKTAADLDAFFGGMTSYAIRRDDIAGAVVVVVKDERVLFSHGYGYADVAKRTPVVPGTTLFRPGSTSKLFTWTAVMQLVQAGKIDLDADVNRYLDFRIPEPLGKITVRNLMTHTPGWEDVARDLLLPKASDLYPIRNYLIERMPNQIFRPGTVIAYSNYGATLAGYIVQRVSGVPFERYVRERVFAPLKMTHSTWLQPPPPALAPHMATGYVKASDGHSVPFEVVEAVPAGAATVSAMDMAHFMLAYLDGGTYDGGTILEPATIRQMWTRQIEPAPGTNLNGFDLGFYQENRNGQEIVGHAGDLEAFHADLHLLPKDRVGVFFAFNSAGKDGAVEQVRVQLFRHFLDRYYPYVPPAETTVADPQADAKRVAGWYQSSRRIERALRFVYTLGQTSVTARSDGTIEVDSLKNPAGVPIRWREVGPLYYRQVDGQSHLKFNTGAQGAVESFASDEFIPVEMSQRVSGLETLGSVKTLLLLTVVVFVVSLLIRLGAWIARRSLKLRFVITPDERWVHLAARIGAIAFLLAILGWVAVLSDPDSILEKSFVTKMELLYVLGLVAVAGCLGILAETGVRVARGPGGWLVRSGEVIVALAGLYAIWFLLAFGMVSFVTNF